MQSVLRWVIVPFCLVIIVVPGFAGTIVGSYHDLTHIYDVHGNTIGWQFFNNYNEVCVYCHTPHNASTAVPLWNRQEYSATYETYFSPNLETAPTQPSPVSRLCLSCHDGVIAVDAVVNVGSSNVIYEGAHGHMVYPAEQSHIDCGFCHEGTFGDFRDSFLTTDLSNDHPISITYVDGPELADTPASGKFANGVRLIDGKVECPTCHDVHDPDITPFLCTSNSGSALCTTCHLK